MQALEKIWLAAICATVMGTAHAQPAPRSADAVASLQPTSDLGLRMPESAVLAPSFLDVVNAEPGARTAIAGIAGGETLRRPRRGPVNAGEPAFRLLAGSDTAVEMLAPQPKAGRTASRAANMAPATPLPRAAASAPATASGDKTFTLLPRPTGANLILCGLLVLVFMARRKRRWTV